MKVFRLTLSTLIVYTTKYTVWDGVVTLHGCMGL